MVILLICGGRNYRGQLAFDAAMAQISFIPDIVVEGGATGADRMGREWAKRKGIHCATVPALWDLYGRPAGHVRNRAMLLLGVNYCVAFPGGPGTAGMVKLCESKGIPVWRPYDI